VCIHVQCVYTHGTRIAFSASGSPAFPFPAIAFPFGVTQVCVMLAGPSYKVIDCCMPTDFSLCGAVDRSTFCARLRCGQGQAQATGSQGGLYDASPHPQPPKSHAASQAPAWLLWIPLITLGRHLDPRRHQQGPARPAYTEYAYSPLFREVNWAFPVCQPPPLLVTCQPGIPSIPWAHIPSCSIAPTVASLFAPHRTALRLAIQVAGF
jgi:hypothetical protein